MRRILVMVLAVVGGVLGLAWGDGATPFVEAGNVEVGAVSEGYGYVVTGADDNGPPFLVIVSSDTDRMVQILATADKDVVPPNLIGRWVIIRAELVKSDGVRRSTSGDGKQLKILSVRKPKDAAAKRGAATAGEAKFGVT